MKMKSKFFGLSAKLALAVLAVGTTLTSCYDSENGDVNKPYTPEPAKYVITGNVTDYETGEAVAATVTVSNFTVTSNGGAFTAVAQGLTASTTVAVEISATGYTSVTRNVIVEPIESGVAVYTVNVALWNEAAIPGIKVEPLAAATADATWDVVNDPAIDIINDTDDPKPWPFTVHGLAAGAEFLGYEDYVSSNTKAIGDTPEEMFINYCDAYLDVNPAEGITTTDVEFPYTLAPKSAINAAVARTYRVDERYTFSVDGTEYSFDIRRISGYAFVPEVVSIDLAHGHGHGHGHGGDLNAGGGIFE